MGCPIRKVEGGMINKSYAGIIARFLEMYIPIGGIWTRRKPRGFGRVRMVGIVPARPGKISDNRRAR